YTPLRSPPSLPTRRSSDLSPSMLVLATRGRVASRAPRGDARTRRLGVRDRRASAPNVDFRLRGWRSVPHGAFLMAATGVRSPGCHGKHVWVPPTWGMALALALGSTRPSDAVAESRVAVLPVNSRSTLPSPTRAHLRDTVERGLRRADVE